MKHKPNIKVSTMLQGTFFKMLNRLTRTLQKLLGTATVGVRALIINKSQEVLLVKHTYAPGWHFPGGGVDHQETPIAAITREVKEEAGIIPLNSPRLFGVYFHLVHGANDYPILYIIDEFKQIDAKSPEIAEVRWCHIDSLPKGTTQGTKHRIIEYLKHQEPRPLW